MHNFANAFSSYNAAIPAAEDSLVAVLAPSVAAADSVQFSAKATVASAEFYTQSVSPLQGVMAAAFLSEGYTPDDADSLGLIAGDGLAIRGAAIVADELTKAIVDSTAQGGPSKRGKSTGGLEDGVYRTESPNAYRCSHEEQMVCYSGGQKAISKIGGLTTV